MLVPRQPAVHEVPTTSLCSSCPATSSELSTAAVDCDQSIDSNSSSNISAHLDTTATVQWAQEADRCLFASAGHEAERAQFLQADGLSYILAALHPDSECRGIVRAKFAAALALMASQNLDYIGQAADEGVDFFEELCLAFRVARKCLEALRAGTEQALSPLEVFTLCSRLYEGCVSLTRHAAFKESLQEAEALLRAIQALLNKEDLVEDPYLAFLYANFLYNLCRSREDCMDIEEGCDPGSPELAEWFRNWCVPQRSSFGVVIHLAKCAIVGSTCVTRMVAFILHFLCAHEGRWPELTACGGVEILLGLVNLEDRYARDAAREALAHLCVSARPDYLRGHVRVRAVPPLVEMLYDSRTHFVRDGARALTQLLSAQGEEERRVALDAGAWQICSGFTVSPHLELRRAATEALCNLSQAPEMIDLFCTGGADPDIATFMNLTATEDRDTKRAASGALAMLAQHPEAAMHIAKNKLFYCMRDLMDLAERAHLAEIDHRCVAFFCAICRAPGVPLSTRTRCYEALLVRRAGPMNPEAKIVLNELLSDEIVLASLAPRSAASKQQGVPPRPPRPPSAEARLQGRGMHQLPTEAKENREPLPNRQLPQKHTQWEVTAPQQKKQRRGLSVDHIAETLLQRLGREDRRRELHAAQVQSSLNNQYRMNKALHDRALNIAAGGA
mmetsp:Transcript_24440/g.56803  ORF Transcript_24440/g.56803 Transcript_24440/m.56803 type:complete len:675 (-) Transcript_24440:130-2154(-)